MKKLLLVGMVLLIALGGVLVGRSCEQDTIQIPGGPRLKVILVDFPKELELKWGKIDVQDFQLIFRGTLKNISGQTVSLDEITFFLNGDLVDRWPTVPGSATPLKPNEEKKFIASEIWHGETTLILEVKIVGFKKVGVATTPTTPITTPTVIITPEDVAVMEVVTMFISGLVEGNYTKVKSYSTSSFLNEYPTEKDFLREVNSPEGVEWRENFKNFKAEKVTIEGDEAEVDGIFYFKKPTKDFPEAIDPSVKFMLTKENGAWKVKVKF